MLSTMKKVIAASLIFLSQLLSYPAISAADSVPDEQYSINNTQSDNRNKFGVVFEDSIDTLRMPS